MYPGMQVTEFICLQPKTLLIQAVMSEIINLLETVRLTAAVDGSSAAAADGFLCLSLTTVKVDSLCHILMLLTS